MLWIYFDLAENSIDKIAEKLPYESIKEAKETVNESGVHKEASVVKLNSIHIKEEQFSVTNKTSRFTAIKQLNVFLFKYFFL